MAVDAAVTMARPAMTTGAIGAAVAATVMAGLSVLQAVTEVAASIEAGRGNR